MGKRDLWRCKDGRLVELEEMNAFHLMNIYRMLLSMKEEYEERNIVLYSKNKRKGADLEDIRKKEAFWKYWLPKVKEVLDNKTYQLPEKMKTKIRTRHTPKIKRGLRIVNGQERN